MRIPLLGGAYEGISVNTSSQEAINFFYEKPAPGETHEGSWVPVHGATSFGSTGDSAAIRSLLYDPGDELLYVQTLDDLWKVDSDATFTQLNSSNLGTTAGRSEMALNPESREILIVDGVGAFLQDITAGTWSAVSDTDFPDAATTCAYINGRFLVNDPTVAGKFWWSDVNDGTAWDSTSFATAETLETPIQKILVDRNDVYLFGSDRSEVWFNSDDPDFIFQRVELIETGIAAPATACRFDNSVVWLARNERGALQVVRAAGSYQPQVISDQNLTRVWETYSTVDDAFAYAYQMDGHEFFVITFPTAGATYAYDALTQRWHQRSGAFSSSEPTREKANCHAYCGDWAGGTHIVGDSGTTGKLFAFSSTVYTFDSVQMDRRLTSAHISAMNEDRLRLSEVQLDCEEGVLDAADTGTERTVTLSWSKDAGQSFSTGVDLDLGESDETAKRLMVRKLGKGRSWVFRIYSATNRKLVIKGLYARAYGASKSG